MQNRKEEYPFKYHPNAYLERRRNVVKGLKARTKILDALATAMSKSEEVRDEKENELAIKAISRSAAMSYSSSLHHLRLLEEEKIVKREGKRPYIWKVTGKGQRSFDELDLDLGTSKAEG